MVVSARYFPTAESCSSASTGTPRDNIMWELVAGHKEPNEDFRRAAPRANLQEETGYTARRYRKLLEIFPSPGLLSERMVIFLAEGLTKGEAQPEEDEKIEARILTLREIERWIRSGKIRDAKSSLRHPCITLAFARRKRQRLRAFRR